VELNRAVAVAMADGPAAGLALLDALAADDRLATYSYFHAARADLLRRLGRASQAITAYRQALELTTNEVERSFLSRRIAAERARDRVH
jgi:RNA polymerase sigma-70 factor (ECF subfamily)